MTKYTLEYNPDLISGLSAWIGMPRENWNKEHIITIEENFLYVDDILMMSTENINRIRINKINGEDIWVLRLLKKNKQNPSITLYFKYDIYKLIQRRISLNKLLD